MSNKSKSISDLVLDLQRENEALKALEHRFDQACKDVFGYDIKTIKRMLEKQRLYEQRQSEKQGQPATFSKLEN